MRLLAVAATLAATLIATPALAQSGPGMSTPPTRSIGELSQLSPTHRYWEICLTGAGEEAVRACGRVIGARVSRLHTATAHYFRSVALTSMGRDQRALRDLRRAFPVPTVPDCPHAGGREVSRVDVPIRREYGEPHGNTIPDPTGASSGKSGHDERTKPLVGECCGLPCHAAVGVVACPTFRPNGGVVHVDDPLGCIHVDSIDVHHAVVGVVDHAGLNVANAAVGVILLPDQFWHERSDDARHRHRPRRPRSTG